MSRARLLLLPLFLFYSFRGNSQRTPPDPTGVVGGGCDGCELMYVGMPKYLTAIDTSVGWAGARTRLLLRGTVYETDGRTPAPGVTVYYWHTDERGHYSGGKPGEVARHGARRGWVKTGPDGTYRIHTNRPAAYPDRATPAHIHLSIKEADLADEYYVDELVFDDDPLLTTAKRNALENRGGSGVLRPREVRGTLLAEHDVILGLHIPNYPEAGQSTPASGRAIGEESPSFTPRHAWGPDRGSRACPVCKYGRHYGVLYFAKTLEPLDDVRRWLRFLEKLSREKGDRLKVYLIVEANGQPEATEALLKRLGRELTVKYLALTWVPRFSDRESDVYLNRIDPRADNTFVVYKGRVIIDRYQDMPPTPGSFDKLMGKMER